MEATSKKPVVFTWLPKRFKRCVIKWKQPRNYFNLLSKSQKLFLSYFLTVVQNDIKCLVGMSIHVNKQLTKMRLLGHFQPLCWRGQTFLFRPTFLWWFEAYKNSEPIWLRWIWSYRSIGFPSVKSEYLCKKWEANWWDNILCSCLCTFAHHHHIHTATKFNIFVRK